MNKLQTSLGVVVCVSFLACSTNEPADTSDGTGASSTGGSGGAGGAGGSGGSPTGGSGGSGGSDGGTGGTGGEGGSPPTGPCAEVPANTIGIIYTAPSPHSDGLVGISAWVECPPGSSDAVCKNVSWGNPFAGCVAADGIDTIMCLFGTRPADTKIRYIPGLYPADNAPANAWFSYFVGAEIKKLGTHVACIGPMVIGAFDGTSFSGALSDTDGNDANQMLTVPTLE